MWRVCTRAAHSMRPAANLTTVWRWRAAFGCKDTLALTRRSFLRLFGTGSPESGNVHVASPEILSGRVPSDSISATENIQVAPESKKMAESVIELNAGIKLMEQEDFKTAVLHFSKAIEVFPENINAYIRRAGCNTRLNHHAEALEDCHKAVKLCHSTKTLEMLCLAYTQIGEVFEDQGKLEEARKYFVMAFKAMPVEEFYENVTRLEQELGPTVQVRPFIKEDLLKTHWAKITKTFGVEIKMTKDNKGRGLFAKRNFDVGEALWHEHPIVSMADNDIDPSEYCDWCMKPIKAVEFDIPEALKKEVLEHLDLDPRSKQQKDLIQWSPVLLEDSGMNNLYTSLQLKQLMHDPVKCEHCNKHIYCSAQCKSHAWDTYHKALCSSTSPEAKAVEDYCEAHRDRDLFPFMVKVVATIALQRPIVPLLNSEAEKEKFYQKLNQQTALFKGLNDQLGRLVYCEDKSKTLAPEEERELMLLSNLFKKATVRSEQNLQYLISVDGFNRLKSLIEMNALSFSCNKVKVTFHSHSVDEHGQNKIHVVSRVKMPLEGSTKQDNQHEASLAPRKGDAVAEITGSGLFHIASYLNHSCSANVSTKYPSLEGNRITFVAARPISAGEEICWSYSNNDDHIAKNQLFTSVYHFECNCTLCASARKLSKRASDDDDGLKEIR